MSDNKNLKRQRAGLVSYVKKLLDGEIKDIMSAVEIENEKLDYLACLKDTIQIKLKSIMECYQGIANEEEEDADYHKVMGEAYEYEVNTNFQLKRIESFLKSHTATNVMGSPEMFASSNNFRSKNNVKLPTIKIKPFSGNPSDYQSFIESFNVAIHNEKSIPDVQKLTYLLGYLEGEAESLLKGFHLSAESYPKALDLLKERFGNKEKLISFHMGKIIEIEPVTNVNNVKSLRNLYGTVETKLRNLETFGMKNEEYGPLLIPLLMNKLPNELQLIISRNNTENKFDLKNLLKLFKNELEAREKISANGSQNLQEERNFTGSSLLTGTEKSNYHGNPSSKSLTTKNSSGSRQCAFCYRNHKEQNCDIVEDKQTRRSIIVKENRCFCCFKLGHSARDCRFNIKCFICERKHHVSICLANEFTEEKDENNSDNDEKTIDDKG